MDGKTGATKLLNPGPTVGMERHRDKVRGYGKATAAAARGTKNLGKNLSKRAAKALLNAGKKRMR